MKKRLIPLLLCGVLLSAVFSGCSCSDKETLEFNNSFYGGEQKSLYSETLTYAITYDDTSLSSTFGENSGITFSFGEGSFVTKFKTLTSFPTLPNDYSSDIKNQASNTSLFYQFESNLTLNVTYNIFGETTSRVDTISSISYFCDVDMALAPIYSYTESDYSILSCDDDVSVTNVKTSCEVIYSKSSYTMISTNNTFGDEQNTKSYNYDFRTLIDNSYLIFALRNITVSDDDVKGLPTVSLNYGEAQTLAIKNAGIGEGTYNITLVNNGQEKTYQEKVSFNKLSFYINSTTKKGSAQTVCIQKASGENTPNRALLLNYTEPLISYGNYASMGSLVYTLTKIEIN